MPLQHRRDKVLADIVQAALDRPNHHAPHRPGAHRRRARRSRYGATLAPAPVAAFRKAELSAYPRLRAITPNVRYSFVSPTL
jgi:hypothetical protein